MAQKTEYFVLMIDAAGDAIDTDSADRRRESQDAYDRWEAGDSHGTIAVVLEKRRSYWSHGRPGRDDEYQVLAMRGDAAALAAGGWELQSELAPA